MIKERKRTEEISEDEHYKEVMEDFDEGPSVRIPLDQETYAVDITLQEVLDEEEAEVGKPTAYFKLYTPDGERAGRYHCLEYDPTVDSDADLDIDGALMGRLGKSRKDITRYADPDALRYLDGEAELLS